MLAILKKKAEPGVYVEDIPIPSIKEDEVLVQVKAAGICGSDVHMYEWTSGYEWQEQYMPLIIGHEFSGVVVDKGKRVSNVKVGDRVACRPFVPCGECLYCRTNRMHMCNRISGNVLGLHVNGGFAEYCALPGSFCVKLPDKVSFEEGALVEPLVVAANSAYNANILMGDTAVFMGPGTIGLLTMLCAKSCGVTKAIVTGTVYDKVRLELAQKLGADYIIYADKENSVNKVIELTGGYGANVVFEATGVPSTIQMGLDMLQKDSILVSIGIHSKLAEIDVTSFVRSSKKIFGSYGGPVTWERVIAWLDSDSQFAAHASKIITHRFKFDQAEEAFDKCVSKEAIKAMFIN